MTCDAIYMNFHCPTLEEAENFARAFFDRELVSTVKIVKDVELFWNDGKETHGTDTVLVVAKTVTRHQDAIEKYILANHSFGTPCIEVVPLSADHC